MNKILYGLAGKKLGHSFSPAYFNSRFHSEHIPAEYLLFEVPDFKDIISKIQDEKTLRGLNVTIPYKQDAIPFLDSLTSTASEIGAVNTIRIDRGKDGEISLHGHNTDAIGFSEAIRPLLGNRRNALMLGLGGASKAVEYALKDLGINITKVSRNKAPGVLSYSDLTQDVMRNHDIIVNCTPLGMWPNIDSCPDVPYQYIDDRYLCFDLVYNPEYTKFMELAARQGAEVSNGLIMLHGQADAAYKFWNTREFKTQDFDDSMIVSCKRVMAREVRVCYYGNKETYNISIAVIYRNAADEIIKIEVRPFQKETCFVEYIDSPLELKIG